jgi:sporulation protein YlmC with PRC-barrel domain
MEAMAMEFTFGDRASCSDGHCGELTRTIFDPAKRTVTHLVIEPRHRPGAGRLVPIELADTTGGEISLSCTRAEFDQFDPSEDVELARDLQDSSGYGPDAVVGYGDVGGLGVGASSSGMGIGASLGHETPTVISENVPEGEGEVARHDHVHATDGLIGELKGFVVDPGDHRVTHLLLREGHLWGRHEIAIPVSAVTAADPIIRLNLTKQQVEELPPRT